jgi:hypothetical protein
MIGVSGKANIILITPEGERHEPASAKPPDGFAALVAPQETIEGLADLAAMAQRFEALITTLMPDLVMSRPLAEQAQRNAELRTRALKEIDMLDSDEVATVLGSHARNRAAAASRLVRNGQVIFVDHGSRRLFPAFQFDLEAGRLRPEAVRVVEALAEREVRGWAALLWLTRPSGWLGGARPVDRLGDEPEKVVAAARDIGVSGG